MDKVHVCLHLLFEVRVASEIRAETHSGHRAKCLVFLEHLDNFHKYFMSSRFVVFGLFHSHRQTDRQTDKCRSKLGSLLNVWLERWCVMSLDWLTANNQDGCEQTASPQLVMIPPAQPEQAKIAQDGPQFRYSFSGWH
jgi:hypothetical protein